MDLRNHIIKIKVKVSQIRDSLFPFDVIYLVHRDNKALLPQLFPYSIVMPFGTDLLELFYRLRFDTTQTVGRAKTGTQVFAFSNATEFKEELLRQCFLVVPVLSQVHNHSKARRRKDRTPAYLIARMHRAGEHRLKKGGTVETPRPRGLEEFTAFFNEHTTLFTPHGPRRPVCTGCPQHLRHVQGKCALGDVACYEALVLHKGVDVVDDENALSPGEENTANEQL